jgi:hypothetical protein
VSVLTGTAKAGGLSSLAAADGNYYVVATANSGAQWSAGFTGVPSPLRGLTITYRGHSSSPCTQNVNLWNWYYSAWVSIANTATGTTDSTVTLSAPGLLSDYVFLGEVRASVQCFRTDAAQFDLSADLLKLTYTT